MRILGLLAILASLLIPLQWVISLTSNYDAIPLISQYIGIIALIGMSWTQLLATRIPGLETCFGGLDRIYVLHKWLGIGSIIAVILHNTFEPEIEGLSNSWLSDFGSSLGGTSHDIFIILAVITIITVIPYRLWFFTHKFMGLLYILSSLHFLLVPKPFALTDPLGIYTSVFCTIGVLSYLYLLLPLSKLKKYPKYKVVDIEHHSQDTQKPSAYSILMEPVNRGIKHKAGQFAFVRFNQSTLNQSHPFTISQASNKKRTLRFSIKAAGNYTKKLPKHIKVGSIAEIDGPYGHFTLNKSKKESIWIGAGIGITPFLACLQEVSDTDSQPIHLFYCVRNKSDAIHIEEIENKSSTLENISVHIIESSVSGKLTVEKIEALTQTTWKNIDIAFCGPKAMRKLLSEGFKEKGLAKSSFHYEEFEIRSGIGLTPIIIWLYKRLQEKLPQSNKVLSYLNEHSSRLLTRLPSWLQ